MKPEIKGLEPDKLNPRNYGGMCSRANALLHRAEGKKIEDGIDTIATTDAPAIVIDWERWELVREILPMKYCELPKNDKAPLLDAHSRMSIEDIKGSGRKWKTEEHDLLCKLFVSETEEDVKKKIEEGHIDSVSIGYQTDPNQTVEIPKKATVIIDGVEYKNEFEDDMPLLVRTWWKIKEISLVPIGADEAAKLKREYQSKFDNPELIDEIKKLTIEINSIKSQGGSNMPEPKQKTPEEIRLERLQLIEDITTASKNFGDAGAKLASKFIDDIVAGKEITLGDFHKAATDEVMKSGGASNKPVSFLGMNDSEIKNFSPARAVAQILMGKRSGFEFEVTQQLEKNTGISVSDKSILLPADIQNVGMRDILNLGKRAHTVGTASEGGNLVTAEFYGNLLKEVIRNKTVLGQLGCTVITGLRGTFELPKITSGLTIYSAAENTAGTTSYIVVGLDTVSPKRLTGDTVYGRQLFFQTDESLAGFDQILMRDLYEAMNVKVDYEGINGTGLSNRPTGLLNQSGIASPSLSSLTFKRLVNFKRKVAKLNGLKDSMKFLSSVDVECLLETTELTPGAPSGKMIYENGKVINYPHLSSNQVPDAVEIFGNWPEFYILNWGVEELIVADQPQHKANMVEISIHRLVNFFLRSAESFAVADDAPVLDWAEFDA